MLREAVPVRVTTAVMKHCDPKLPVEEMFLTVPYDKQFIIKNSEGGKLQAGADAQPCLLACSACFLLVFQDHQARGGTAHSELGPPTSITS